jgi:Rrf2 family protein
VKLNNTSQYAIRILNFIATKDASHNETLLYHAKDLSDTLDISYKYLTKIMTQLVKSEIILSIRGREGGYKLAKKASTIRVLDILDAVNESLISKECILGIGACDQHNKCALHDQWVKPKTMIEEMFKETYLDSLEHKELKF